MQKKCFISNQLIENKNAKVVETVSNVENGHVFENKYYHEKFDKIMLENGYKCMICGKIVFKIRYSMLYNSVSYNLYLCHDCNNNIKKSPIPNEERQIIIIDFIKDNIKNILNTDILESHIETKHLSNEYEKIIKKNIYIDII